MPVVATYCSTFLKPEMLHIYRQITALKKFSTFVLTVDRQSEDLYPFEDVEVLQVPKKNFVRRYWLKHVLKRHEIEYRGDFQPLIKILRRREPDLMHIYFGHTGVHLLPIIDAWDKPVIVSFHGVDVQERPHQPDYAPRMQKMLAQARLILVRSDSLAERVVALGCPPEKIRINRTGIPLGAFPFEQRTFPADGAWQFVQACRFISKKGIPTSLKAFAIFHQKYPKSRFVLAGSGPMKNEIVKLLQTLEIEDAVEVVPFQNQTELAALYHASHAVLHPSQLDDDLNQEGIPNAMLEAMATGLPPLATYHGGIPEAVTHGENGLLVAERDHEALAAEMLSLAASTDQWQSLSESAAESIRNNFEQARQIARLESFYAEAAGLESTPAERGFQAPAC